MLYADYKAEVFRCYEMKKEEGLISLRLADPSPAKLRAECITICGDRFSIRDQGILKDFFGPIGEDAVSCIKVINRFDPDRFKPLINYLRKKTKETDSRNIELLAWLIDYEPRPWGRKLIPAQIEQKREDSGINRNAVFGAPQLPQEAAPQDSDEVKKGKSVLNDRGFSLLKGSQKRGIIAILMVLVALVAVYWLSDKKVNPKPSIDNQMCMYWAGDHYEPVDCNQKVKGALVIALDSHRLKHFRLIIDTDTITRNSIGIVHYIKINGKIEFYTAPGFHPIDVRRRLWPMSENIFVKYVEASKAPNDSNRQASAQ